MADCLDRLREAYGEKLTESELKNVDSFIKSLRNKYSRNVSEYNKQLKLALNEAETQALRKQKAEINSTVRLKKNIDRILDPGFKNASEGLLSLWEGTTKPIEGSANSVENLKATYMAMNMSQFNSLLKSKNLINLLVDETTQRKIWSDYIEKARNPNFKSNASAPVQEAVNSINKLNNFLIKQEQDAGSTILFNPERIVANLHDPDKVLKNVDEWINTTLDLLDFDRSFGPTVTTRKQAESALRKMAKQMGDFMQGEIQPGQLMGGVKGIFFKDGNAGYEYMKRYGSGNLYTGLMKSINTSAKKAAVTKVFGNDPIRQYKKLKSFVEDNLRETAAQDLDKADKAMMFYRGAGHRFEDPNSFGAKAFQAVQAGKTYMALRSLGKAGWAVLEDLPMTLVSVRSVDNKNIIHQSGTVMTNFIKSVPEAFRKDVGERALVMMDDIEREFLEMAGDYQVSMTSRISDAYMNINLTKPLTRLTRSTAEKVFLQSLADNVTSKKLDPQQEVARKVIGLTDQDIDKLKNMVKSGKLDEINLVREDQELALKVGAYLNMMVDRGVPTVNARQSRLLQRFRSKDDYTRMAMSIASQFKTSLLTVSHSWEAAQRYRNPTTGNLLSMNSAANLAQLSFAVVTFNYGKLMIRDLIDGNLEEEINIDTETARMTKAVGNSSVGGIMVDSLLATLNNKTFLLTPPLANQVGKVVKNVKNEAKLTVTDDFKFIRRMEREGDFADRQLDFILNNMPGQNLWLIEAIKANIIKEADYRNRNGSN